MGRYWLQTLGCPKNQVDSDKLEGYLEAQGYAPAHDLAAADLVVVNTCAFIDAARQESIETVLNLADRGRAGARLVVTGCMAERYGDELRDALPEVDLVAGFGRDLVAPAAVPRVVSDRTACAGVRRRWRAPVSTCWNYLGPPPGPLGVREGGRGLRPHLRLLRHPVLPGQAALPLPRGDFGRGGCTSLRRRRRLRRRLRRREAAPPRDCARRTGPRLLRPRPHGARPGRPHRTRTLADRRAHPCRRCTRGAHAAALSVSVGPDGRTDRDRARDRGALLRPLPPARVAPTPRRHAPLGGRRAFPASHRGHPRRRPRGHLPILVHSRLSRRDRARPRPAPPIHRGGTARLGRLLPFLPRGGHSRRRPGGPGAARARARASAASAASSRTPSPPPSATNS